MQKRLNLSYVSLSDVSTSDDEEKLFEDNKKAVDTLYAARFRNNFTCANPHGSKYPHLHPNLAKSFNNHLQELGFDIKDGEAKTFPCGSIFELIDKTLMSVNLAVANKPNQQVRQLLPQLNCHTPQVPTLEYADESVLFIPASSFGYMAHTAKVSGCKVVILKLDENGCIDKTIFTEKLDKYKHRTKVFAMINPNNPTATFWSQQEVDSLTPYLQDMDLIIEDATFAGITPEALRKALKAPLDDDFAKRDTAKYQDFKAEKEAFKEYVNSSNFKSSHKPGSCFNNSDLQEKTMLFYSPAKELSAEYRISCTVVPKKLQNNLKSKFNFDTEGGLGSFNFNKDCQNGTIALLNDPNKATENTNYYIARFKQVKQIINAFNQLLSTKLKVENTEFIKLTPKEFTATNVVTLDCSGLRGLVVDGEVLEKDLVLFNKIVKYAKAGLVPGSANFTRSDKMHLRIVLGEEYDSYYGFEEGLCNFEKYINPKKQELANGTPLQGSVTPLHPSSSSNNSSMNSSKSTGHDSDNEDTDNLCITSFESSSDDKQARIDLVQQFQSKFISALSSKYPNNATKCTITPSVFKGTK